jgi:hypothetical protein
MITPGTILMERDTLHPPCFQLGDDTYAKGWISVKHDITPYEREKELASAGWTFFYMASPIRTTSFGFDRAKMMSAALKRLIKNVTLQKCNCLEIDDVETHSLLGIPYVSVSAHPRHIQKGLVFGQ